MAASLLSSSSLSCVQVLLVWLIARAWNAQAYHLRAPQNVSIYSKVEHPLTEHLRLADSDAGPAHPNHEASKTVSSSNHVSEKEPNNHAEPQHGLGSQGEFQWYDSDWGNEYHAGSYPNWQLTHRQADELTHAITGDYKSPSIGVTSNCVPDPFEHMSTTYLAMVLCMLIVVMFVWALAGQTHGPPASVASGLDVATAPPSPSASNIKRVNIDALDGLRTVFIVYIALYHQRWILPEAMKEYFMVGHWAVQYFFVLSGFVTLYAVQGQRSDFDFKAGARFFVRRMVRLFPAYFVALLWLGAFAVIEEGRDASMPRPLLAWPLSALFLQSVVPVTVCGPLGTWNRNNVVFAGNYVGWFVSCIVFTAMCFPLIFNLRPRGGILKTLSWLLLVIGLRSAPTIWEISQSHISLDSELGLTDWQTHTFNVYGFCLPRLLEFIAGVLTAQLCLQLPASLLEWQGWGCMFDLLLVLLLTSKNWVLKVFVSGPPFGDYFLTAICCMICIAARGASEPSTRGGGKASNYFHKAIFFRLLASQPPVWLAQFSYGAYILQEPVSQSINRAFGGLLPQERMWPCMLFGYWFASIICSKVIEAPVWNAFETRMHRAT